MCQICETIVTLDVSEALALVAKAISKGKKPEHFKPALDQLLGTTLEERDLAIEEAWENKNRKKSNE